MINVGIVGLGFMAATHIKAYHQVEGIRVTALCSPSGRRLDGDFSDVAGNIGTQEPLKLDMTQVRGYRDFAEMLANPDIHAIDICTPTLAHKDQAIAALKAGKHVLCEKPLARTSAQAREILAVASVTDRVFLPAMCARWWPGWWWLKQTIDSGIYGKVLGARFRRVAQPPGWGQHNFLEGAKSGGALLDLHIHDVDFVQWCFGAPKSVYATGYSSLSGAVDHVLAQYAYDSGVMVHAEGSWAFADGFGFNKAYTVNFERATADFDLARSKEALKLFVNGQPPEILSTDGPDGYIGEITHFRDCIRAGTQPTVVTGMDALNDLLLCEAEEQSIRDGKVVEFTFPTSRD